MQQNKQADKCQRSSHTHCQVAQADTQAKTWQRVCLPHPEKIELKKISLPSENKKYATAQPDTTKTETAKLNKDKGLQTRKTEGLLLTTKASLRPEDGQ